MQKRRKHQFSFLFLIVAVQLCSSLLFVNSVLAKTLKNMSWLSEKNRSAPIHLEIDGEILDLDRDTEAIVSYYEKKLPDEFLLPDRRVGGREAPECAQDMKTNTYRLRRHDTKIELPEDLTWAENPFNDRNWQFKLHSWGFLDCLMKGYEASGDLWYLDRLKWFVEDWWEDNFVQKPPSKEFSWYDHSLPLRLGALIGIWEFVRRHEGLDEEFVKTSLRLVYWQGRILNEEASVRMDNHNHGLDQADYLLRAALIFPELEYSSRWRVDALARFKREIEFMMSSEGIQKENSPAYHMSYGASAFRRIQWFEHYIDKDISTSLSNLEDEALKFATVITQPNGYLPQIGDTGADVRLNISLPNLKTLSWFPHYQYVVSNGKSGIPPANHRFIFPETGYYIYRDRWDAPGENSATQLIMKCGFLAEGHRHDDDGNLLLYGLGEPWLTDGGQFAYEHNDVRSYMLSPYAHNVTIPVGVKTQKNLQKRLTVFADSWGISASSPTQLDSVSCSSHMYRGYVYTRSLDVTGPQRFKVTDRLIKNTRGANPTFMTQFRVPQDKTITLGAGRASVEIESPSGNKMIIRFSEKLIDRVEFFSGQSGDRLSVDTAGWREVMPVQTVSLWWAESVRISPVEFEFEIELLPKELGE